MDFTESIITDAVPMSEDIVIPKSFKYDIKYTVCHPLLFTDYAVGGDYVKLHTSTDTLGQSIESWNNPLENASVSCLCGALGAQHSVLEPYGFEPNGCPTFVSHQQYYLVKCHCGHDFSDHTQGHKGPCQFWGGCSCPYFGSKGTTNPVPVKPPTVENQTKSPAPQRILDLVPGSVSEDWNKHKKGGWIYKTAVVHSTASVQEEAVVYGKAKINAYTIVYGKAKVFDNAVVMDHCMIEGSAKIGKDAVIGTGSTISGQAKVFGNVGNFCTVSGKTYVKVGINVPHHSVLKQSPSDVRTQKARGIKTLKDYGFAVPPHSIYRIERLKTTAQLEHLLDKFVRPCPVTPRHGFVDSRPVATIEEAKAIVKETKAADKQAEVIAMPFIKASHSGIWTPGQLSIGTGTDGATAGKDSIMIPVQGDVPVPYGVTMEPLLKAAGVTDAPYMEVLWEQNQPLISSKKSTDYSLKYVQLRNGPKLPQSVDYIPVPTKVKEVVVAEGDLLEWETKVKLFKKGTVVYHPGGSLASHYAVHAFLSEIPVMITREPQVGETIEANTTLPASNIEEIRRGFFVGCTMDIQCCDATSVMLAGCHSTTQWAGRYDLFLGMAMGCCYRLLATAALGEYRHKNRMLGFGGTQPSREQVYTEVWDVILTPPIRQRFEDSLKSFDEDACWNGSMGGAKWYILGRWATMIYNALADGDIKAALEALNKGVNSVHNGGWSFNKFADVGEMNLTAKHPINSVIRIAPHLYDSLKLATVIGDFTKYDIKKIDDIEKYVEDKWNEKKLKAAEKLNYKKLCCKAVSCCGNPDCSECHKEEIKSDPKTESPIVIENWTLIYDACPYKEEYGEGHYGPNAWVTLGDTGQFFPVCETHLPIYIDAGGMVIPIPDKYETKLMVVKDANKDNDDAEEDDKYCGCLSHTCDDCYPAGCLCNCSHCHDEGCGNCQNENEPEPEILI